MLVVVQTYPAHFYQTLACLQSIRSLDRECEIWLFADDFSNFSWGSYISTCHDTYRGLADRIIPFSDQPVLYRLRSWPWLRQQTNKLLLDSVIDRSSWLFIDGDVQLRRWPPSDRVAASVHAYQGVPLSERDPRPGEMSSQVLFYIRHMLGSEFEGFWRDDGRSITASNPPVKYMQAGLLQELRLHIHERFGRSLVDVHLGIANDTRMSACEWDLIECYRQTVLGQSSAWLFDYDWYDTTWSADRELGQNWFEANGIAVDPEIWQLLPESKNYL